LVVVGLAAMFVLAVAKGVIVSVIAGEVKGAIEACLKDRVQRAAAILPDGLREQFEQEWIGEVQALKERPLTALRFTRGLPAAARQIALEAAPAPIGVDRAGETESAADPDEAGEMARDHDKPSLLIPEAARADRTDEMARAPGPLGLSTSQAATALGVSLGTIRRWSDLGYLKSYRTPGGQLRFSAAAIDSFLDTLQNGAFETGSNSASPSSRETADRHARRIV
jgi:excisionase family DNA binding protein